MEIDKMQADRFTGDPRVRELISELQAGWNDRDISDIVDEEGRQYVDLVMEGGGVLGIALLGYTYALEEVGIRFLSIGGTSAGSIGALLLAAVDTKEHPKSLKITEALANQDISEFVDGPRRARRFIFGALKKAGRIRLIYSYLRARSGFIRHLGFNPGEEFLEWLTATLREHGITTEEELRMRMNHVPHGLRNRAGESSADDGKWARLAIIAAEISTETKVEFPKMAPLFWEDSNNINPACYVRASMSIPYFFHPYRLPVPQGDDARTNWDELASYRSALPQEATLVDGGIMSNFPIDVFHKSNKVPAAPTFGVKLGTDKRTLQPIEKPASLGLAAFNSARHCLDYDFIKRNPDYKHLVAYIDTRSSQTGEEYNWLDFNLTDEAKIDLFRRGVQAAHEFFQKFDWEEYKKIRADLIASHGADEA